MDYINKIELNMIYKIVNDNFVFSRTKVEKQMFSDPILKGMFGFIGLCMTKFGGFNYSNFNDFISDTKVIELVDRIKYPINLTKEGILEFFNSELIDDTKDYKYYERQIIEDFHRRKLIEMTESVRADIDDKRKSSEELLRKYSHFIDNLMFSTNEDIEFYSTNDLVSQELAYQASTEVIKYVKTGINCYDDVAGGVAAPALIMTFAPPKNGKSQLLYNNIINWLEEGKTVGLFTIEIPADEARRKLMACYVELKYHDITNKALTDEEKVYYNSKLLEFEERFKDKLFLVYNKSGLSPKQIEVYYNILRKSGITLDCIGIDYLLLLQSNKGNVSDTERYTSLAQELRILTQRTNTIIHCPSQLHTSKANTDIDKITIDDIYYAKTASFEATVLGVMMMDKDKALKIKMLPSRIGTNDKIYEFVGYDYDTIKIRNDEPIVEFA